MTLRGSENGNRYSRTGFEVMTRSGVMIDVRAPRPEQIRLADIARSLAQQVRFTGHCPLAPTVAQHSLAVAHIAGLLMPDEWAPDLGPEECRRRLKLAALLHDAPEYLVSDLEAGELIEAGYGELLTFTGYGTGYYGMGYYGIPQGIGG